MRFLTNSEIIKFFDDCNRLSSILDITDDKWPHTYDYYPLPFGHVFGARKLLPRFYFLKPRGVSPFFYFEKIKTVFMDHNCFIGLSNQLKSNCEDMSHFDLLLLNHVAVNIFPTIIEEYSDSGYNEKIKKWSEAFQKIKSRMHSVDRYHESRMGFSIPDPDCLDSSFDYDDIEYIKSCIDIDKMTKGKSQKIKRFNEISKINSSGVDILVFMMASYLFSGNSHVRKIVKDFNPDNKKSINNLLSDIRFIRSAISYIDRDDVVFITFDMGIVKFWNALKPVFQNEIIKTDMVIPYFDFLKVKSPT